MNKDIFRVGLEKTGEIYGKVVLGPGLRVAKEFARQSDVRIKGLEVFQQVGEKPVVVAANHIKPKDIRVESMQLIPDAIVIAQAVESTGRNIDILTKADDGWVAAKGSIRRKLQDIIRPFARGLLNGSDQLIPVNRNPGVLNRNLFSDAQQAIKKGKSLLIMATGELYQDWDPAQKIQPGTAKLAIANNLPIIPTYIRGGDRWDRHHPIDLVFGAPIDPTGKTENEITEAIRNGITNAKASISV